MERTRERHDRQVHWMEGKVLGRVRYCTNKQLEIIPEVEGSQSLLPRILLPIAKEGFIYLFLNIKLATQWLTS